MLNFYSSITVKKKVNPNQIKSPVTTQHQVKIYKNKNEKQITKNCTMPSGSYTTQPTKKF